LFAVLAVQHGDRIPKATDADLVECNPAFVRS
jgi:hypothetical protein